MPPHSVIARFAELVSRDVPVVAADRVTGPRPSLAGELPALVVDLALNDEATVSGSRYVREGNVERGPRRTERLAGVLGVEVWANSRAGLMTLSQRLQDRLGDVVAAKAVMLVRLRPERLSAGEALLQATPLGSAFPAWRQRLEYAFAYDGAFEDPMTEGAPIRRIDVEMDDRLPDHLTIGA